MSDLQQDAEAIFQEAVERYRGETDNRSLVRADFEGDMRIALAPGEATVTPAHMNRLLQGYYWGIVSRRAAHAASAHLPDLLSGASHDIHLDTPVAVSRNRYVLVRDLTEADLDRIVTVQEERLVRAQAALQQTKDAAALLAERLIAHGSMEAVLAEMREWRS